MSERRLVILGSSSQQHTRERNHGAYLLKWNGEGLLFDPGEGTQRQFIFAEVPPPCVTRIFISHFHGDHCLGLGSMLMRLNLDKVTHPIHCYYPASGKVYFDRLRYSTIYHETIRVIEHPVHAPGLVHEDAHFKIEAEFLDHGVDNVGWRITEPDVVKFDAAKLKDAGILGPSVRLLEAQGSLVTNGKTVRLEDVSWVRKGSVFVMISDTKWTPKAISLAKDATLLLSESTYLDVHHTLAHNHNHLTAKQAAQIAKEAGAKMLILTHFSARYQDLNPFLQEARAIFPNTQVAEDLKSFEFSY